MAAVEFVGVLQRVESLLTRLIAAVAEKPTGLKQRGWTESGLVKSTSVIDTTLVGAEGLTKIGGIAFTGTRGVEAVELSIDDGQWIKAEADRPLSRMTWVLWRAELHLTPGDHTISVRAIDGEGNIQTANTSPTQPDGASGHHSINITV